jgi:ribosomal-protein-alanine N-acetyltransferase
VTDTAAVTAIRIEGERIYLRDFVTTDLDATMAIVGDPEVTAFLSFDTKSRREQAALLADTIERAQLVRRSEYYLAVVLRDTDELIGFARLGLGAHRSAKLGYAIRRTDWGRGLATESAKTLVVYGFQQLGLHRITAACGPDNPASQQVLVKLGFSLEGRLREHVFTNRAWRDSLLYSLLDTDLDLPTADLDLPAV